MSIRFKLLSVLLLIGAGAVITTGFLGYQAGKRGLTQSAMNHLTGIRRSKARQIEAYFRTIRSQVRTLRENRIAIDGVRAFTAEFNKLDGPKPSPELETILSDYYKTEYLPKLHKLVPARADFQNYMPVGRGAYALQRAFLVRNPFPTGSKELLEASGDVRGYSRVHAAYHRSFRKITEKFGIASPTRPCW